MGFYQTIVLLLGVTVTAVVGRSTGAPSSACSTVSPNHVGTTPQTSAVPYTVNISSLTNGYVPGQSYTIILSGTATDGIQGFLIQARVMAGNTATGTFTDNGDDQQLVCDGNTGATHTSAIEKTMVQLMWNAPPMGTGTILFRYAFVDTQNMYWANQATGTVDEAVTVTSDTVTTTATISTIEASSTTVTVTSDTVTTTATISTIEASSTTVTVTSDTVTATTTTSTIEASSITVTATSDTVTTTASTVEASSTTVTATSDTVTTTTTTSTIEASSITVTVTQTTNATTNTTEASSTSMSTMPSSAPADITSTPSASTTPTAEATPDGGGATGVMAASSVMLMLLASIITLIN